MANPVSLPPRTAPLQTTQATEPAEGKIGLDGSEVKAEPKPAGWTAQTAEAPAKPAPYTKKVDLTGDFAFGVLGGALNDRRTASAAGQPANQSLSNLLPNIGSPRADFSGYGLGAGGNAISSAAGKASIEHNAVHIGIGASVYLFERARGATRTEAALGSLATGVGIEVGQSLQRAPAQEHVGDAGRFDVSDVARTASGALVGMGVEAAVGALIKDKTDNPLYNVMSHITAFDIGKDAHGKPKVSVQAQFSF